MRRLIALVLLAMGVCGILVLCSAGCGSSVDPADQPDPGGKLGAGDGAVRFAIKWPQPEAGARLIPTGTDHITVEIYDGEEVTPEVSFTIRRSDVVAGTVARQVAVRASATKTIAVLAWDSQEQVVSQATQEFSIGQGQVVHLALDLQATGITAPVVTASASTDLCLVGDSIQLTGSATDTDGTIALYQWDCNGDGVFEVQSPTSGNTTVSLPAGDYIAELRVTDNDGLSTDAFVPFTFTAPYGPTWSSVPSTLTADTGQPTEPVTLVFDEGFPSTPCTLTVAPNTVKWNQTGSGTNSFTGTFTSTDPSFVGSVAATLTVTDSGGNSDDASVELTFEQSREWTWIVYVAAANNLEDAAFEDVNEMEAASTSSAIQVIALVDTTSTQGTYQESWAGDCYRYVIRHDSNRNAITSPSTNLGPIDSGDWHNVKDIVAWAVQNYPANRYGIIFWDHGAGFRSPGVIPPFKGVCYDDDSGNGLDVDEIPGALVDLPGGKADIVGMDACLMGMAELAYELQDCAGFYVASEELVPGSGFEYQDMFNRIILDSAKSNTKIATDMVDSYEACYSPDAGGGETLSAVDCSKMASVAEAADTFAGLALTNWSAPTPGQWTQIINGTTCFGDIEFLDMYDLGTQGNATFTSQSLKDAITRFRSAISGAVVANWANTGAPAASGLSIWVPASHSAGSLPKYRTLRWTDDTRWDEFLAMSAP
jgi:hypothetical protein